MPLYIRLPAGLPNLGRHDDGAVVFSPGLKVLVQARIDPIFVFGNGHLAIIRRNRLCDPTKIGNGIVVHPDPVADIAAGHSLDIEIIAVRQCRHKDGYFGGHLQIAAVVNAQRLSGIIQFCIDSGKPLNVEGNLGAVEPIRISPAKLAVAQRLSSVHCSCGVVLLPQMLERFPFLRQGTMYFFRVEIPVEFRIYVVASLLIQAPGDEFVGDLF